MKIIELVVRRGFAWCKFRQNRSTISKCLIDTSKVGFCLMENGFDQTTRHIAILPAVL